MLKFLKKAFISLADTNVNILLLYIYLFIAFNFINRITNQIGRIINILESMSVKTGATSVQLSELMQKMDSITTNQNNLTQFLNIFIAAVAVLLLFFGVIVSIAAFKKK